MAKILRFIIIFLALGIIISLFFIRSDKARKVRLQVVCTTNIIANTVSQLVDDDIEVYSLMGPGVDPHLYRAKESDVARLMHANLILYNGLHLEGKMADVFEKMNAYTTVVAVADVIPAQQLIGSGFEELYDPHVWHDVSLWQRVVDRITQALITVDYKHADKYEKKASELKNVLQKLHQDILVRTQKLKKKQRVLVTAHDAFSYFGRAYDFEVVGLQGISTDSDISTKDIQQLADLIVEKKVPAIFIESSIPHRTILAVQNAVESRGWNVNIGSELFSDALDVPGSKAGSYEGMITYNVDAIISALSMD